MVPGSDGSADPDDGEFLPWRLALSREIVLPKTGERIPFQQVNIGVMRPGISDPDRPDFYSLADWYSKGDVLEIRIPWMMLGFTDPSQLEVWNNLYRAGKVEPVQTEGVRVYPALNPSGPGETEIQPISYGWKAWNEPDFYERKKESYFILREAYRDKNLMPVP